MRVCNNCSKSLVAHEKLRKIHSKICYPDQHCIFYGWINEIIGYGVSGLPKEPIALRKNCNSLVDRQTAIVSS